MNEELEKLRGLLTAAVKNFDTQKSENDKTVAQLKSLGEKYTQLQADFEKLKEGGDSDAMQKLADTIEELQLKMEGVASKLKHPANAINTPEQKAAVEDIAKKAVGSYFKSGANERRNDFTKYVTDFAEAQFKTLEITNPSNGGVAVASYLDRDVLDYTMDYAVIAGEILKKGSITRKYTQTIRITRVGISEGIENVAGTVPAQTSTQKYVTIESKEFKLYASPRITNEALMGTDIDVYSDLVALLGEDAGEYLNAQLWYGDGSGKNARGILSSNRVDITDGTGESWKPTTTTDGTGARDPDFFPVYGTGVAGDFGADDKAKVDWLIDYMSKLPKRYRAGAKHYMNENTFNMWKKVRDANEKPILITNYMDGVATDRLMGKPVVIDDTLPDVATDSTPMIYGDFTRAFAYNDGDIDQMLLDPYTIKGSLIVYMEKEYFEMMQRSDAIIIATCTTNDDVA